MKMKTLVIVMIVAMLLVVTVGTAFASPPPERPPWSEAHNNIWLENSQSNGQYGWGYYVSTNRGSPHRPPPP